jgi:hypothetical protein
MRNIRWGAFIPRASACRRLTRCGASRGAHIRNLSPLTRRSITPLVRVDLLLRFLSDTPRAPRRRHLQGASLLSKLSVDSPSERPRRWSPVCLVQAFQGRHGKAFLIDSACVVGAPLHAESAATTPIAPFRPPVVLAALT